MVKMSDHPSILICGDKSSGKSTMALEYLNFHLDIPIGTVIDPSDRASSYHGKIPTMFIHPNYHSSLGQRILAHQKKSGKRAIDDDTGKEDPRAFLILDEAENDWQHDPQFKLLLSKRKAISTTIIVIDNHITPELASNFDYVFIGHQDRCQLQKIHQLFGIFDSLDQLVEVVQQISKQHRFLVLNRHGHSHDNLSKSLYWYRADLERLHHFTICHPKYWTLEDRLRQQSEKVKRDEKTPS